MRLEHVRISAFKNLRDLNVDFDEASPYTVLVGENGAGKSNLIEALTIIFRNLDLDVEAPFDYDLRYECRGNLISVSAKADQLPSFRVRRPGEVNYFDLSRKMFMSDDEEERPRYRPAFVFGYYSGPSDRLSVLFEKHRERFYSWIIKSPEQRLRNPLILRYCNQALDCA